MQGRMNLVFLCRLVMGRGRAALVSFGWLLLATAIWGEAASQLYGRPVVEIRIKGARFTQPEVIHRELVSQVGAPYTQEAAQQDPARLDRLDIFTHIAVRAMPQGEGVAVEVEVEEILPYLPFFSYQITDENGFAGGPGFQSVNFRGRDVQVYSSARFGGATNINLAYADPWLAGNHLSLAIEGYQRDRFNKLDDFAETASEIDVELGSYIGANGRVGGRLSFISLGSDTPGKTLDGDDRDNFLTLALSAGYDSRDWWSDPHTGWWNGLEVAHSGGPLGGDADFTTLTVDLRRYIPVFPRHTLALFALTGLRRGQMGRDIPRHQDYHLGGTNSVRGWELDSRRGKNQFIQTTEYRYTLIEPKVLRLFGQSADLGLQLAAFGDVGVAWDEDGPELDDFIGGYGVGLRLLMPFVHMFRFDVAWGQKRAGMQFNIGAYEKPVAQRFRVR